LISSLSSYARINEYRLHRVALPQGEGRPRDRLRPDRQRRRFSEFKAGEIVEKRQSRRRQRRAEARRVTEPFCFYLSAWEEDRYVVAQANATLDEKGPLVTPNWSTAARPATSC
jgi:DNA-directed RNA polymerase subunit beta